jgi:hypothetical protein
MLRGNPIYRVRISYAHFYLYDGRLAVRMPRLIGQGYLKSAVVWDSCDMRSLSRHEMAIGVPNYSNKAAKFGQFLPIGGSVMRKFIK